MVNKSVVDPKPAASEPEPAKKFDIDEHGTVVAKADNRRPIITDQPFPDID